MATTNSSGTRRIALDQLTEALSSPSVLSKDFATFRNLRVVLVDDNFLFNEEAIALMTAFNDMGLNSFNWCVTKYLFENSLDTDCIHSVPTTYEHFRSEYYDAEGDVQYWDRLIFNDALDAIVLHTAHDHLIYAGSKQFVNTATSRSNTFDNDGIAVIGSALSDPELLQEYGLPKYSSNLPRPDTTLEKRVPGGFPPVRP